MMLSEKFGGDGNQSIKATFFNVMIIGLAASVGLAKLPVVGGLFGTQGRSASRSEVVLLITPRVVRSPQQTRTLTDDYLQRFQGLAPLRAPGAAPATPAVEPPPGG